MARWYTSPHYKLRPIKQHEPHTKQSTSHMDCLLQSTCPSGPVPCWTRGCHKIYSTPPHFLEPKRLQRYTQATRNTHMYVGEVVARTRRTAGLWAWKAFTREIKGQVAPSKSEYVPSVAWVILHSMWEELWPIFWLILAHFTPVKYLLLTHIFCLHYIGWI